MSVSRLLHYTIRTQNVDACKRFYVEVVGLREGYRPSFDFPGAWLYTPDTDPGNAYGIIHLVGVDGAEGEVAAYLGNRSSTGGTGSLDHIAFAARDAQAMRSRLEAHKVPYRERVVPDVALRQLFFTDPEGIEIELNFPADERNWDDAALTPGTPRQRPPDREPRTALSFPGVLYRHAAILRHDPHLACAGGGVGADLLAGLGFGRGRSDDRNASIGW
jgi:catechol 2,3-dioxygenase-like lactoylglutathione lyase family enzyme